MDVGATCGRDGRRAPFAESDFAGTVRLVFKRDLEATEVLHEYFVPMNRLGEFVEQIRPILFRRKPDLLNITVRSVQADADMAMRFAREDVFGLVMLFHQHRT